MNPKYLICTLIAGLMILSGSDTNIAKAASAKANQTITITVPPMRILYVDEENRIVSILSNIPVIADEKLRAFKAGVEITVSSEIRSQYEKLLSIVDWSKIGWVYQQTNLEVELFEMAEPVKQADSKVDACLEKTVSEQIVGEVAISCENVFGSVPKLNTLPLPPHKGNYCLRATVYDAEALTEVSAEYLLQSRY